MMMRTGNQSSYSFAVCYRPISDRKYTPPIPMKGGKLKVLNNYH